MYCLCVLKNSLSITLTNAFLCMLKGIFALQFYLHSLNLQYLNNEIFGGENEMQRILFWIFTSSLLFLGYFFYDVITMQGPINDAIEKPSSEVIIEEGDAYLNEIKELIGDPLDFTSGASTKAGSNIEQSQSALIQQSTIVTYQVTNDALSKKIINTANTNQTEFARNTIAYNQLWDTFRTIIPKDLRTNIYSFFVFSDGANILLGYVEPLDYNGDTWQLGVDFVDSTDKNTFITL